MIDILSWKPKCIKNTFQAITSKVEENLRTFQGLPLKLKDFSRLCEPYSTEVSPTYSCSHFLSFSDLISLEPEVNSSSAR